MIYSLYVCICIITHTYIVQWNLSTRDRLGMGVLCPSYSGASLQGKVGDRVLFTVEPLYKGQVGDRGPLSLIHWSLFTRHKLGTGSFIRWSLSTRDKLGTGVLCPLYSGASLQGTSWGRGPLYSGASLQGTSWGQRVLCPLYSGLASLQGDKLGMRCFAVEPLFYY